MSTSLRGAVVVVVLSLAGACSSTAHNAATTTPTTTAPRTTAARLAVTPLAATSAAYVFTFTSGGRKRDYRLHVPPAASAGKALPLVLNLHGATQNGTPQELQSGMDASSDRNGYLVAYPDGTRIAAKLDPDPIAKDAQYGFNAGYCCGLPVDQHVDDVSFLLAVISDTAARTPVDLRRVYVTGMSNGGMMAYAMAAQAADRIAAIASVSGQVELPSIHPSRIGSERTRLPVAWWTALAMAAWIPAVPSMPIPLTPLGKCGSCSSIIAISNSGMSAWTGIR